MYKSACNTFEASETINTSVSAQADDVADAEVEGSGWGSSGGGPGEEGRMILNVGVMLLFTHEATVELWLFTPSAALLTVSMRSPGKHAVFRSGRQPVHGLFSRHSVVII